MAEQFALELPALEAARLGMLGASVRLATRGAELPVVRIASLSGVGETVAQFLSALKIARHELADAARAGSMALSALMLSSGEIDAALARPLSPAALLTLER